MPLWLIIILAVICWLVGTALICNAEIAKGNFWKGYLYLQQWVFGGLLLIVFAGLIGYLMLMMPR